MNIESIRMALSGIRTNRMRSGLTMLGILIGVAAVIILVAVGSGSAAASRARLEGLGSNTLTVSAGGLGFGARGGTQSRATSINDTDVAALDDQTQAPDVSVAVPVVSAQSLTMAYNGASTSPSQIVGTTSSYFTVRNAPVSVGATFTAADLDDRERVAVIGTTVAKNLLGETGDPAALVGQSVKLGNANYTIIGILKSKGSNGPQDQDDIVVVPYTALRDTAVGNTTTVNQVIVQARSAAATTPAETEIQAILLARHTSATSNSFRIQNQTALLQTQSENNRTFTVLLGSVAAISLLVGGIGVMNIMLVTVTERTREIGIRKAVGTQPHAIIGQFLTEAVLLSFLGGVLGVAAGYAGSRFTIVGIEPVVETYSVLLAVGVAAAIGLFFGIYPASRAARLRPIDALRYE